MMQYTHYVGIFTNLLFNTTGLLNRVTIEVTLTSWNLGKLPKHTPKQAQQTSETFKNFQKQKTKKSVQKRNSPEKSRETLAQKYQNLNHYK